MGGGFIYENREREMGESLGKNMVPSTLIIEIPENDLARKMVIINELHRNKIVYDIDDSGNILIDGFGLEKVRENRTESFFIKYEVSVNKPLVKWVYVKAKNPNIYYRIKAMHCPTIKSYIKALKRRMLPSSCVKMATYSQIV